MMPIISPADDVSADDWRYMSADCRRLSTFFARAECRAMAAGARFRQRMLLTIASRLADTAVMSFSNACRLLNDKFH